MSEESILTIEKFAGINTEVSKTILEDNELSTCINFDLNESGELRKRTGWNDAIPGGVGAFPVEVLGLYTTSTVTQLIARSGTNLYYSDTGLEWTVIPGGPWGNISHGIQYTGLFYMTRSDDTIIKWDGTTATAIASSPAGTHAAVFKDRLFIINTVGALPSRMYFSTIADFETTGWIANNFIDVSTGDGDVLVAVIASREQLHFFKSKSIWNLVVQGDPSNWGLINFTRKVGCQSKYTIKFGEGVIYFLGSDGVYQTDGVTYDKVSDSLNSIFEMQLTEAARLNQSSAFYWKDKYVIMIELIDEPVTWGVFQEGTWSQLAYQPWESGFMYRYYAYHTKNRQWTEWQPAGVTPHKFVEITSGLNLRGVFSGERVGTGRTLKYGDTLYKDISIAYPAEILTKEFDFEAPMNYKRGKWVGVAQVSSGQFTLQCNDVSTSLVADPNKPLTKHKGPGYFRTCSIRYIATHDSSIRLLSISLALHRKRAVIASAS